MSKHSCTPSSSYLCHTVTASEPPAHPRDKLCHESEETGPGDHTSNQDFTDENTDFFMKKIPIWTKKVDPAGSEDYDTE